MLAEQTEFDSDGFRFMRNRGCDDEWRCVCGAETYNKKDHAEQCMHNHTWVVSHAKEAARHKAKRDD